MPIPQEFLDEVRNRTPISGLIAGSGIKLIRSGREWKACCPFHNEKTPSFTVTDEKAFYHCHGCGAHGDVFRWKTDFEGLSFMDALRDLAGAAGMEVPAPSPEAADRAARIETVRGALDLAQAVYAEQLTETGAVMEYLSGRGITPDEIAAFGIGYARGGAGSLKGRGIGEAMGRAAGLLVEREAIGPGSSPVVGEMFWDRITIPIHDRRGRLIGFGGRVWPGRRGDTPKFVNTPETALFDKGRTLFNLHRAAAHARPVPIGRPANVASGSMPGAADEPEGRLVVAEGYFDVIALARAGVKAAVAPLGTALTEAQLVLAWRLHHRPTLLFDGDGAGRRAALRACKTALPALAAGRELAVALLPEGKDPDDLLRELGTEAAAREIEALLIEAVPAHEFLYREVSALPDDASPEARAAVWAELAELAGAIEDQDVRAQYLGVWRQRFDREVSAVPALAAEETFHAVRRADDGDYVFPESDSDSAARLIAIVRAALKRREERKAITEEIKDLMSMAKAIGFDTKEINVVIRDIESDLAHGSAVREESEMVRVLYRRTLGIRGPMTEAMLPQVVDARARPANAQMKRRAAMNALIDARAAEV